MKSKSNLSILNISLASGGTEKVISLLLKKLVEDYNVTLFLIYNEIHFNIPDEVNVIIFSSKPPQHKPVYLKLLDLVIFTIKYYRAVKKLKIKFAVSFLAFPNLINGIISIFNKNITTYISERGFPSDNTSSKSSLFISKIFYPLLYNKCDKLFSNSIYINQDLKDNFGINIPMEVIYNPIEIPNKIRAPLEIMVEPLKIINVGTLNTRKNQAMILKAFDRLESDCYTLSILGSGHLQDELIQKANRIKGNNRITFVGKVKNVGDYLLKHNCFVLSSYTEGFPNALLEAMSYGLPCISTNCLSGPLELLNDNQSIEIKKGEFVLGKYGILVNNNDHDALASALEFFIKNPHKRAYFSKMSYQRAKNYELNSIYSQLNNFIQS